MASGFVYIDFKNRVFSVDTHDVSDIISAERYSQILESGTVYLIVEAIQ